MGDTKKEVLIGISYFSNFQSSLWGMVDYFTRLEAKNKNFNLITRIASNDLSLQISQIQELVYKKIDALLIAVGSSEDAGLVSQIQKTLHQGIPVIAMDSEIGNGDYTSIVSVDNMRCQQSVATYIFDQLNGQGKVAHIQGIPHFRSSQLRAEGFHKALAQYPNIELVFEVAGNYQSNRAFQIMTEYLSTNLKLDAVIAANDSTAKGVYVACKRAGITPPILISGFDADYAALSAMFKGNLSATIKYDPEQMAQKSVDMALRALNGENIPKQEFMDIQLITPGNLENAIIHSLETLPRFVTNLAVTNEQLQQEIRERKQAQIELTAYADELEYSNRELSNFAYIASHDLREPLRKIQIFGNRLEEKYNDVLDRRGLDYLARMQRSSARMQTFIEDLLTYSRLSKNTDGLQETNLNYILQNILEDIKQQIQECAADITYNELPTLEANPTQMNQLFQNLLSNAIKFQQQDSNPIIHITSQPLNNQAVQIEVTDNGIGFEPEYAERIFGMFQRLHGRSKYDGTGIGLAICRKIVERHQGSITASGEKGKGAIFNITLPITQNSKSTANS